MPIEIKELVIRAVAESDEERPAAAAPAPTSAEDRQAIVEAAVKEVLRILREAKER
ncbi:MAG: hypothetical protein HUU21_11475 [Polyangiaceae bacterium]|nr:DUF5908 family protein [Polyangiaceae bacterium]NUQ74166.1 hypothetical protein [Polyangiaceae bacterium]